MKKLLILFFLLGLTLHSFSQADPYTGTWEGILQVGADLRIVFHIDQNDKGNLVSTADSPDQYAFGIKCDSTYLKNGELVIEINSLRASYTGVLSNDSVLTGRFVQQAELPLVLKKKNNATPVRLNRPQTPKPPFPYHSEDIHYYNKDKSIQFGATITIPEGKGPFPAIVLVSGSGPQNRNGEVLGHQLFAVLADHLTRNGFIVLRYDERGVGESTGRFSVATTAGFAEDAGAAVDYLRTRTEVDKKKMGLIGHSEGGIVVPMVAAARKDINFLVLLAAPGIRTLSMMAEQNEAIAIKNGATEEEGKAFGLLYRRIIPSIAQAPDSLAALQQTAMLTENWAKGKDAKLLSALNLATAKSRFNYISALVPQVRTKWFDYFLGIDPAVYIQQLHCKVLALNGDKDIQVLASSNLDGIRNALKNSGTKQYEIKELPGLNHLFQHCNSCTINEYKEIEETFSSEALSLISNWLATNIN